MDMEKLRQWSIKGMRIIISFLALAIIAMTLYVVIPRLLR